MSKATHHKPGNKFYFESICQPDGILSSHPDQPEYCELSHMPGGRRDQLAVLAFAKARGVVPAWAHRVLSAAELAEFRAAARRVGGR